ncbi:lectin like domain-containing protein [Butyrivibrio sp. AE3009]|uniref:lectin like domain-containing protein n=1 Tax=Butyrivibrio sp. AE3009 TaxID=1280666 RepID=UPI0003B3F44A|nr:lectin like domain-containing protein [Butyrivibrio sp. AE3009]
MKKRVLALLLSGIMFFSAGGTALATGVEGEIGESLQGKEEYVLPEVIEEEADADAEATEVVEDAEEGEEFTVLSEDAEEESIELEEAEDSESTSDEVDLTSDATASEVTEGSEENATFATGLNHEGMVREVIKGDAADDAEFQETYASYYVNKNLPPLRNQNPYGTCWAFAMNALTEINLRQNGIMSNPDLSELHLAYFTNNSVVDPLGGTKGDYVKAGSNTFLNDGGNFEEAFCTYAKWTGAASEANVPYSNAARVQRSGLADSYAYDDQVHLVNALTAYIDMNSFRSSKDITALNPVKKMIKEYGAAGIYFGAVDSMEGVTSSKIYSDQYKSYYNPESMMSNHAVVVVGWDDNFSRDKFASRAPGNGAFLVRNSWTTKGDLNNLDYTGYFWMSYYEATLDDYFYAVKATTADNYDNNYQYDGYFNGKYSYTDKGANVFTAHADGGSKGEILKAVTFYSLAESTGYTIDIYTNVKDTPSSGRLVKEATTTGTVDFSGFYNVTLKNPVELAPGTKFAVVVTLDAGGLMYDISRSGAKFSTVANSGESYYGYGKSWYPLDHNYRIKAYTDNSSSVIEEDPAANEPVLNSITLSRKSTVDNVDGRWVNTTTVVAGYDPSDYVPKGKITWASSKPEVATINSDGVLTFISVGTTTITATVDGVTGSIDIVVSPYDIPDPEEPVDDPTPDPNPDPSDDTPFWGDITDEAIREYFDNDPDEVPEGVWYVVGDDVIDIYDAGVADTFFEKNYTGGKITFNNEISVYHGITKFKYSKDYTISYANNVNATRVGAVRPSFTVKFKKKNFSKQKFYFDIEKESLSRAYVASESVVAVAKGKKKLSSVKVKVTYGKKTLKAGRDYVLKYEDSYGEIVNPSAVILDDIDEEYKINVVAAENGNFTGDTYDPVTVVVYDRADKGVINASKFTVKGVDGKALRFDYGYMVSGELIQKMFRNGKAEVWYKDQLLDYGIDYDIISLDNDYSTLGTHKVRIVGKYAMTHFVGSKTVSFKVTPYNFTTDEDLDSRVVVKVYGDYYTGKAVKPDTEVYFYHADGSAEKLQQGVDYTLSYKNNVKIASFDDDFKPPTVIVKGKGRFKGTVKDTFSIYGWEDDDYEGAGDGGSLDASDSGAAAMSAPGT